MPYAPHHQTPSSQAYNTPRQGDFLRPALAATDRGYALFTQRRGRGFSEVSVRGAQSQVKMALVGRSAFSWMMRPEPAATMRLGRGS